MLPPSSFPGAFGVWKPIRVTSWRDSGKFWQAVSRRRRMMRRLVCLGASMMLGLLCAAPLASGQSAPPAPADPWCRSTPEAPFCHAVRGVRASGWPAQSRSEVMAGNGMVVTSQPLAAQAGLEVLMRGGNAIDAAVATAGVLSLTEPMMVGIASDLFAVIYIAKEHKVYVLNASGTAPTGATLEHLNQLGYHWDATNWGPASGMPTAGILPVTVPGTVWGWQSALQRFGK